MADLVIHFKLVRSRAFCWGEDWPLVQGLHSLQNRHRGAFLDHFKIALHRRLIFSATTDPLLKGLAHFKIVAPSVFFRSLQNRQALSIFPRGLPREAPRARGFISKIDQPRSFSRRAPAAGPKRARCVSRWARRPPPRCLAFVPGTWLVARGWLGRRG